VRVAGLAAVALLLLAGRAGADEGVGTRINDTSTSLFERIHWLAGCWWSGNEKRIVEEQWMGASGGLMLGMGRTTSRGHDLIEYEQTRIAEQGIRLVYTARPSGQPEASFTSIQVTDSVVVFENAAHDFPQRVGYQLLADGRLNAWIEGTKDGKTRHIDFPYQRVACQGSAK
jgi:hypothetical protein